MEIAASDVKLAESPHKDLKISADSLELDAPTQCSKLITPNERCANVLDTEGSPKWCKKCRAKYQREYQALQPELAEKRGYGRGVQQLRNFLVLEFERLGSGAFTGYEIAELIRQAQLRD